MENQQDILKTVIDGLVYIPTKDMIVKPLEDEYVEKEIIKPVETGKRTKMVMISMIPKQLKKRY